MKTWLKCPYCCIRCTWILICHCTSCSYVIFQQKVRLTVSQCTVHTLRIIREVYNSILYPLRVLCLRILFIEHSIFPLYSWLPTQWPWTLTSFKLTSIMSVLYEKLHMSCNMTVDDNWSIVLYVVVQVLQIWVFESQFIWFSLNTFNTTIVRTPRFFMHIKYSLILELWHSFHLPYL